MHVTNTVAERPARVKRRTGGFTMLDIALWMGFAALAAGALYAILNQANSQNATSQALVLLNTLRTNVKQLNTSGSTYGTASLNQQLIDAGGVPRKAINGTTIQNPFGGSVNIEGQGLSYTIQMGGLPTSGCARMATQDTGAASENGVLALTINGQSITLPPTLDSVSSACSQAGGGASGGNTIVWTYS